MNGKGDKRRPEDQRAILDNWPEMDVAIFCARCGRKLERGVWVYVDGERMHPECQ